MSTQTFAYDTLGNKVQAFIDKGVTYIQKGPDFFRIPDGYTVQTEGGIYKKTASGSIKVSSHNQAVANTMFGQIEETTTPKGTDTKLDFSTTQSSPILTDLFSGLSAMFSSSKSEQRGNYVNEQELLNKVTINNVEDNWGTISGWYDKGLLSDGVFGKITDILNKAMNSKYDANVAYNEANGIPPIVDHSGTIAQQTADRELRNSSQQANTLLEWVDKNKFLVVGIVAGLGAIAIIDR